MAVAIHRPNLTHKKQASCREVVNAASRWAPQFRSIEQVLLERAAVQSSSCPVYRKVVWALHFADSHSPFPSFQTWARRGRDVVEIVLFLRFPQTVGACLEEKLVTKAVRNHARELYYKLCHRRRPSLFPDACMNARRSLLFSVPWHCTLCLCGTQKKL
jgi:hypothetical protein